MFNRSTIIAGNSHTACITGPNPSGLLDNELLPVKGREGVLGLFGAPVRDASYWSTLTKVANGRNVALLWRGGDHIGWFLIEQDPPFDFFYAPRADWLPRDGHVVVPYLQVRERFASLCEALVRLLRDIKDNDGRVVVVGTPPPKGPAEELLKRLRAEKFIISQLEKVGRSPDDVTITDHRILVKLWGVMQDALQRAAAAAGVDFIPVPEEFYDELGLLRREYWGGDVSHANPLYGSRMLDRILSHFEAESYDAPL